MRRVVVTGIGTLTPVGSSRQGLWDGVLAGRSAIRRITRFDPSEFRSQNAGQVDTFDPLDHMEPRAARRLDRFAQFGVAAARGAIADAELDLQTVDRTRAGVAIGSALGGIAHAEHEHSAFLRDGLRAVGTLLAIAVYGGASGANIAIDLDLRGPNLANASSCASGCIAIGDAMRTIRRGEADVMIAGGIETPLAPLAFGAFALIKAMSACGRPELACKPFDQDRDGFVMAEGAAILVLEERDHALRRDARILAEITGFAQTNDAYHMTAPRPDGEEGARAIELALRDAGSPGDVIGYVNAHATGTPLGDRAESLAITRALGPGVPVSGTKALYGHALGASGAIETAITALALHHGVLPGTVNLRNPDTECALNHVCRPVQRSISHAVTTSFGFGGVNAALVLCKDGA